MAFDNFKVLRNLLALWLWFSFFKVLFKVQKIYLDFGIETDGIANSFSGFIQPEVSRLHSINSEAEVHLVPILYSLALLHSVL